MPVEVDIRINKGGSGEYEDVAKLVIVNDGTGTVEFGNYHYSLTQRRRRPETGEIVQFDRSNGAVALVTFVLEELGYGL